MTEHNFAWFAGVDWGSEGHQACLVDAQGRIVGERRFLHGGTGLADLCDWLLSIGGAADTVARTPDTPCLAGGADAGGGSRVPRHPMGRPYGHYQHQKPAARQRVGAATERPRSSRLH